MHRVGSLVVAMVVLWFTLTYAALVAQEIDVSKFPLHEQNAINSCLGVMRAQPTLYAYFCVNGAGQRMLRFSQKSAKAVNGRHPEDLPQAPDMALDLYGLKMSETARKALEAAVVEHNKQVLAKREAAAAPAQPDPEREARFRAAHAAAQQAAEKLAAEKEAVAGAEPPKRSPTGSREDYLRLAQLLSYDYRLGEREVTLETTPSSLELLNRLDSPQIKRATGTMVLGLVSAKRLEGSGTEAAAKAARYADEIREAAERGAFNEKVELYETDDRGNLRKIEYEVDRSLVPQVLSGIGAAVVAEVAPEWEKIQRRLVLDGARIRAWDELLPEMAQQHAGPLTQRQLVQIDYLDDGPGGKPLKEEIKPSLPFAPSAADTFRGRYVAKNLAPRDLHNVTLAVDFCHYSTMPAAALRHVYFIPLWRAGQTLEFSRSFLLDLARGGKFYQVDAEGGLGSNAVPIVNPELQGLAGMVRMRTTLWSDEARQAPQEQVIQPRVKAVSAILIGYAEQTAMSRYSVTASWTKPEDAGRAERNAQYLINDHLRPVVAMLPPDSTDAQHARRLMADFLPVRKELLKRNDAALLAACAPGKKYVGKQVGVGYSPLEVGVLFVACDKEGGRIRAEIFDPRVPTHRRTIGGYLGSSDPYSPSTLLLESLTAFAGFKPRVSTDFLGDALDPKAAAYQFALIRGNFVGMATIQKTAHWDAPGGVPFLLTEVPSDPQELEQAKARDKAAPQTQPKRPPAGSDSAANPPPARPSTTTSPPSGTTAVGAGSPVESRAVPTGGSPLAGTPADSTKPKKLTPAEARAKAQADAQNEKIAVNSLALAKKAIARKDTNMAKVYLQQAISIAPNSPAAKQAAKLLEQLGDN